MTFEDLVPAPTGRFEGITRPYTPADVAKLRGSVAIEHTLARRGANRLWELLKSEDYINALGAMSGNQAMQQVRAGLKAIIAPTTVGVVAAAQVVTDENLIGKVNVTGLALPSEFKKFIDNGASQAVALWNPIDLGYSAVYLAHDLAVKKEEAKPGATLSIGRVGKVTLDDTNSAAMAPPFQSIDPGTLRVDAAELTLRRDFKQTLFQGLVRIWTRRPSMAR
eukprot:gene35383-47549_t